MSWTAQRSNLAAARCSPPIFTRAHPSTRFCHPVISGHRPLSRCPSLILGGLPSVATLMPTRVCRSPPPPEAYLHSHSHKHGNRATNIKLNTNPGSHSTPVKFRQSRVLPLRCRRPDRNVSVSAPLFDPLTDARSTTETLATLRQSESTPHTLPLRRRLAPVEMHHEARVFALGPGIALRRLALSHTNDGMFPHLLPPLPRPISAAIEL
mmetsp:Transcript_3262/g.10200  ORF Transcript_3262/g.10200 Transcript_3262/m.10200 type:complete len:209 (+) Transcript_3262:706-1332(+)